MRTIKYIVAVLIGFLASCGEDFVNLENPNLNTSASFWKTQEDAVLGTNAMYQALIYDGTYMRKYPWTMDVRSDDAYNVTPYTYVMSNLTRYTIGGEEVEQPWECNYVGIWRANQVLDNLANISMDAALKDRCLGEAHFIRGLSYFNSLNEYKNVVMYTHIPQSVDDFYIPQSDPAVVWDFVYQDLKDAIDMCWDRGKTTDLGRATKGAAAALLAKAYLMNDRFSDAQPYLKNIIDGVYGTYGLVDNYRDNFIEGTENNLESIFEIQYDMQYGSTQGWIGDPQPNWQKQDGYNKSLAAQPFGWGDIAPSVYIYNAFQEEKTIDGKNDPRMEASLFFYHEDSAEYQIYGYYQDTLYKDDFFTQLTKPLDGMNFATTGRSDLGMGDDYKVFIRKYVTEDPLLDRAWKSGINRRLIRYADILLLYAECLNEAGNVAGAAQYIQMVRDRAKLPDREAEFAAYSQDQMRARIDHERLLELCFETWRYLDLMRWGYFESQDKVNTILIPRDPEYKNWIPGREYLAIPPTEIERTNGIVKQNPAWN
jgi:starch-binding outer membrane protein, SusD/RagB family